MVAAPEKGSTECTNGFDMAYVRQGEGETQHWLLLLEHFLMRAAAGRLQRSCEREQCDGMST